MTREEILVKAAGALSEEADLHRESCQIAKPNAAPLEWACPDCDVKTCPSKTRHNELKLLAGGLLAMARPA